MFVSLSTCLKKIERLSPFENKQSSCFCLRTKWSQSTVVDFLVDHKIISTMNEIDHLKNTGLNVFIYGYVNLADVANAISCSLRLRTEADKQLCGDFCLPQNIRLFFLITQSKMVDKTLAYLILRRLNNRKSSVCFLDPNAMVAIRTQIMCTF